MSEKVKQLDWMEGETPEGVPAEVLARFASMSKTDGADGEVLALCAQQGLVSFETLSGDSVGIASASTRVRPQKAPSQKKAKKSKADKKMEAEKAAAAIESAKAAALDSEWAKMGLNMELAAGVIHSGFPSPFAIQTRAIPSAIEGNHTLIEAETGSGKTLAFVLPVIHSWVARRELETARGVAQGTAPADIEHDHSMYALMVAPTRELALQIASVATSCGRMVGCRVACLVGGLAVQKQTRQLDHNPAIVVCTPGRLLQFLEDTPHTHLLVGMRTVRWLVLDEADKMLEKGRFGGLVQALKKMDEASVHPQLIIASATLSPPDNHRDRSLKIPQKGIMADCVRAIKNEYQGGEIHGRPVRSLMGSASVQTPSALVERWARCSSFEDKGARALYLLITREVKTLVFVDSIRLAKSFVGMLQLLSMPAWSVHASMPQRQRLKNMDRLRSVEGCIIVCTDVAARGLDVPSVDMVVHLCAPVSPEVYVHRAGRAGRAGRPGLSVALVAPRDEGAYASARALLGAEETASYSGYDSMPFRTGSLNLMRNVYAQATLLERREAALRESCRDISTNARMLLEAGLGEQEELTEEQKERERDRHTEVDIIRSDLRKMLKTDITARTVAEALALKNNTDASLDIVLRESPRKVDVARGAKAKAKAKAKALRRQRWQEERAAEEEAEMDAADAAMEEGEEGDAEVEEAEAEPVAVPAPKPKRRPVPVSRLNATALVKGMMRKTRK
ncbi:hypothetical protein KIPB_000214 [Kipferlia bialata]|uniref:ATP-dependent RNA helicase n=1 Tax=Kipferlia bialata TaxID=797122 RepID=A0A9K3CNG1_9EUKA|nr:hypothetical protein KIPB_000214 [Kipferlia bialata]|eukprot:g214.t1